MKGKKVVRKNEHSRSSKSSQSRSNHQQSSKKCSPKDKKPTKTGKSSRSLEKINNNTPKSKGKKKLESAQSINQQEKDNFLPGQKYKTPDEQNGALAFYKSLYEQNPQSQMARRYCVEYGVLEYEEAKRLFQSLSKVKPSK